MIVAEAVEHRDLTLQRRVSWSAFVLHRFGVHPDFQTFSEATRTTLISSSFVDDAFAFFAATPILAHVLPMATYGALNKELRIQKSPKNDFFYKKKNSKKRNSEKSGIQDLSRTYFKKSGTAITTKNSIVFAARVILTDATRHIE